MALPTWVDTAGFAGGDADITADGRDVPGWTSMRGSSSIVSGAYIADAGYYTSQLDNRARLYDPLYASGTYYGDLVPGVPFQKVATYAATAYEVFTGTVDGWPQFYPISGLDQTVDLQCTDAIGAFADAQLAFTRPAERSGTRIAAVVTEVGWGGPTDIAPGTTLVGPLTNWSASAWSHMQDVANCEFADLYVSADGTLVFRDRTEITTATRSTVSQASFGDTSGLKYSDVTMGSPPIVNDCTVTYGDNARQETFQDTTSMAQPWGTRSLNLNLPFQTASDARTYARWICQLFSNPITTITSMTIKPERDPANLWPQVLGREIGDLITVTRTPGVDSGNGQLVSSTAITKTVWIRGIQHSYANRAWTTTFWLQDAGWSQGLARFDTSTFDGPDVFGL